MIGIRVNSDRESVCRECQISWSDTPEMYDILLCGKKVSLCKGCIDKLFQKTLRASCAYNAKVKSQEDMQRIQKYKKRMEGKVSSI